MSKSCGRCRRFLSPAESARCRHCDGYFHLRCVALPPAGTVSPSWQCPGCIKSKPNTKKPETFIAQESSLQTTNTNSECQLSVSSPANSSFESTKELTSDIAEELRIFRDYLRSVNKDLQTFRDELAVIKVNIQKYQQKVDTLEERVVHLEEKQSPQSGDADKVICQLRKELNERDQELLDYDIEVANLPEVSGENPIHVVIQLAAKIGVTLEQRDVMRAERVGGRRIVATNAAGPEERPRLLAVRLGRRDLRDEMLRNARIRRGVTSEDLVPGAPRRFYINERLTKVNRQLFRLARDAGQRSEWKFVWVKRGRIFARNKPGDKVYAIREESDIEQIFGTSAT